jgi:hypothetical protein
VRFGQDRVVPATIAVEAERIALDRSCSVLHLLVWRFQ